MRIGEFVTVFPSGETEVYGPGRVAYHLAKELAERGHEVYVFSSFTDDVVKRQGSLTVYFYKSLFKIGFSYISPKLLFNPLKHDIDLVHAHSDTPVSVLAGLMYAKKKRKPLVVTWHGEWSENYGSIIRRVGVWISKKWLISRVLASADIIVVPSEYFIEESIFLKRYRDKIIEIPNGVDIETFAAPYSKEEVRKILGLEERGRVVLQVSVLLERKGPHILLKAIPRVVERCENVTFVFVGGGELERYRMLARKLGVEKYVKFTGYVKEGEKLLYYKAADVFVLPSVEEVMPLALLEASAAGLPIVASDLTTLRRIIEDGYNGLFVKRGDPRSLADAIIYLLENEDVRERIGKNARERIKEYSWSRIAERYEEIFKELVKHD
ncbi:MAG: glycosyltransferase family 4 protein [Crenarchaeota archaeon]|nr:glycosyltransferase family 4 protein [Thermoproteota archaeon]